MEIAGQKILVTGGTGFIGGHLVEELLQRNAQVIVVDIKCELNSYFSLKKFYNAANFFLTDISDTQIFFSLCKKYKPSFIFHLAAETIVTRAYKNPLHTFQTNLMGTVSILEAARNLSFIKGVIIASSDKAYGKTDKPYNEDTPLKGDHPYDVSKSCTDLISYTYYKTYGVPIVVTRFGNVYGEGDLNMNRIIPGICESVIKNEKLALRSNGEYIRDYLYVKDVVNGYMALYSNFKQIIGEAFNFSSTETYSVLSLIKTAQEILKIEIPYIILNTAKNEIPYQHLIDKKVRRLGWKNKYSLSTTLNKIVNWYTPLFDEYE